MPHVPAIHEWVSRAFGGRRQRERSLFSWQALEVLEDRAVPSTTTVLGVPAPDVPTSQDLGLPPLVAVPVSADVQASSAVAQLFGGQPSMSMFIPVPQFLTPSGTSTVTTSWTGPVTFTNFSVNSQQLNELANQIVLPDGSSPYVSPYLQAVSIQTASQLDVVHFVVEPLTLDVQGVHVALSGVDLTMSFSDVPGSSFFVGPKAASPISVVSRSLDLFVQGLGIAQQKANEVAGDVALPAPVSAIVRQLAPATTGSVQVAQYQVVPTEIDGQSVTIDIAQGATVDVSAATGPNELLGNLLAGAVSLETTGLATLDDFRSLVMKDLLSISPLEILDEILTGLPFGSLAVDPYLFHDALDALIFSPVMGALLTMKDGQSDPPVPNARGQGSLGGVWYLYDADNPSLFGSLGLSSSSGPGGDRIQLDESLEEEPVAQEDASRVWDENPLPDVLPDLDGPVQGDPSRSRPAAENQKTALRNAQASDGGLWTSVLTCQVSLMAPALVADGPFESLSEQGTQPVGDGAVEEPEAARVTDVAAPDDRALISVASTDRADADDRPAAPSLIGLLALWTLCEWRLWKELAAAGSSFPAASRPDESSGEGGPDRKRPRGDESLAVC